LTKVKAVPTAPADHGPMLTLEDCIGLCGLSEDEVHAIAEHEHITELAAAELGHYLCESAEGEMCVKAMILDDMASARDRGHRERLLALKVLLRNFILQHPRCEQRHRDELVLPDRRLAGRG